MDKSFSNSIFSRVFTYNDHDVHNWSKNVYDKIKKSKILPSYVKRSMEFDEVPATLNTDAQYFVNHDFTYGNSLILTGQDEISLANSIDLGTRYELSFELKNKPIGNTVISISSSIQISIESDEYSFSILGETYTETILGTLFVKIIRDRETFTLYINGVQKLVVEEAVDLGSTVLEQLIEFEVEYECYVSNFRVLSINRQKILHWWKLNCDKENEFIDIGLNDFDFYAFWGSITQFFANIVRFVKFFRLDEVDMNFVKRFLDSKDISYPTDADDPTLLFLFYNWKDILEERATSEIYNEKNSTYNDSLIGVDNGDDYTLTLSLSEEVSTSTDFEINMSLYLEDDLEPYIIFDNINISKTGGDLTIVMSVVDGSNSIESEVVVTGVEDGNHEIKIIKNGNSFNVYVDDVLQTSTSTITLIHPIYKFTTIVDNFKTGQIIDHISIKYSDSEIKYTFNSKDSLFVSDITKNPIYEARIFGLSTYNLSQFYGINQFDVQEISDFKEVDGELLNLYNKKASTELVFAKAGFFDTAWVLGKNSPTSYQTYPIRMFNKLPNQTEEVKELKYFPLRRQDSGVSIEYDEMAPENGKISIYKLDTVYRDVVKADLNVDDSSYCKDWIVNCMAEKSYEVSFRMEVIGDDIDFNLTFQMIGDYFKNIKTGTSSNSFITNLNVFKSGYYWIRGIIYSNEETLSNTLLGLSIDVENTNHLQFNSGLVDVTTSMNIRMLNNSAEQPQILLSDFQFRLLQLSTPKFVLGSKSSAYIYGRNNSQFSDEELFDKAQKLIPYNINLKTV